MSKTIASLFLFSLSLTTMFAQDSLQTKLWTLDDCMSYAVENSHRVHQQQYTYKNYQEDLHASVGAFFPSLSAGTGAQYSYGRSIDPETNTYKNTTTFSNAYQLTLSVPVFDGGQIFNQWRQAKINRNMGKNDLQKAKDDLAIETMRAFTDVVYYRRMTELMRDKLAESNRTLYKISRQEELGLKGKADVAQIEAQVATDDYNLTHQQNLYNTAMMTLKQKMNFPTTETLSVDTMIANLGLPENSSVEDVYSHAADTNPTALQATFKYESSRMDYQIAKSRLFPRISFNAGVSTDYFDNLKAETSGQSFSSQFKNNRGEYLYMSLSFPLFDNLTRITTLRKARNSMRIASENQQEVMRQLHTDIEQSLLDYAGYAKELVQMEKKVVADELAYKVTLRKFEEGLMSPLDLQTSSNTLLESRANLVQKKLLYLLSDRLVEYYKGNKIIRN